MRPHHGGTSLPHSRWTGAPSKGFCGLAAAECDVQQCLSRKELRPAQAGGPFTPDGPLPRSGIKGAAPPGASRRLRPMGPGFRSRALLLADLSARTCRSQDTLQPEVHAADGGRGTVPEVRAGQPSRSRWV